MTAACLAKLGHRVIGVDTNPVKVQAVNAGHAAVLERGLEEAVAIEVQRGMLSATTSAAEAVQSSEVMLICVGTPSLASGLPDLKGVARVSEEIGKALVGRRERVTVVLRSTAPPGTVERIIQPALAAGLAGSGPSPRVASNPEFMREGHALNDFFHPPFLLVGCNEQAVESQLFSLYEGVQGPFHRTSIRNAEMLKYASNAFHAIKVCFANEIDDLARVMGADGGEVMRLFKLDQKLNLSASYLSPGFAFGGSCLGKDLRAILSTGAKAGVHAPMLTSVIPSNKSRIDRAVEAVISTGLMRVGLLGLAFKPGTDDMRESPLMEFMSALLQAGREVRVYDRQIKPSELLGANKEVITHQILDLGGVLCEDLGALLDHAEVLVIGHGGAEAERAVAEAAPGTVIFDLNASTVIRPVGLRTAQAGT